MAFGARSFNGTSDGINCGTPSVPSGVSATMSGSAWIYPTSFPNAYNGILSRTDGTHNAAFFGVKSTGALALYLNDNSGSNFSYDPGSHTLSANTWYHVAFSCPASGGATGYLNGASDGVTNSNTGIMSITANQSIGIQLQPSLSSWFAGRIADAALWNIALTVAEISALASGIRPYNIREPNIIGYWPCDGVNSPEPDLSGFGNNGTLTGTINAAGPPLAMFTPRWPLSIDIAAAPPALQLMGQAML